MPLNATTYLEEHGWEGKGVALDGRQGRGLKKPLALPMKRNQRGLGKDRDRATEWWDCLFETSAKSISIQVGQGQSKAADKALEGASALSQKKGKEQSSALEKVVAAKTGKVSLASQAKREYARKMLMSGFVRAGKASLIDAAETELERILLEQEKRQPEEALIEVAEPTKEERRQIRNEKRKRKEEKRLRREAKEKSKESKKRKRDEGDKAKDKDRKESKRSKKSLPPSDMI